MNENQESHLFTNLPTRTLCETEFVPVVPQNSLLIHPFDIKTEINHDEESATSEGHMREDAAYMNSLKLDRYTTDVTPIKFEKETFAVEIVPQNSIPNNHLQLSVKTEIDIDEGNLSNEDSEVEYHQGEISYEIQTPTPSKRKKDEQRKITNYFIVEKDPTSTKTTDKLATCALCTTKTIVLKMKNCGTSSLRRHLQSKHPVIFKEYFETKEGSTESTSKNDNPPTPRFSEQINSFEHQLKLAQSIINSSANFQTALQELLVDYVVKKYLPFNFFEDAISEKFFKFLNPNVKMPNRNQMNLLCVNKFGKVQNDFKTFLKQGNSKISFSIDGWFSSNLTGYHGITAHFIDKNWKLHSILLDFVATNGQQTEIDVSKLFLSVLHFYDLANSVQGIVTDNTNSTGTFMRELQNYVCDLDPVNCHMVCFGVVINLGAKKFLKILDSEFEIFDYEKCNETECDDEEVISSANSPIQKMYRVVKILKNSDSLRNDFERYCTSLNVSMAMPKYEVVTRWYSTYDLLEWSLSMKNILNIICDSYEYLKPLKQTDDEWLLIERVCQYLKSFKTFSSILEGQTCCTLPMAIVAMNLLSEKLENWFNDLNNKNNRSEIDEKCISSIQTTRDNINNHFNKTNWIYYVVLILDPRFKVETFSLTNWGKTLEKEAVLCFETLYKTKYFQHAPPTPLSSNTNENTVQGNYDIDVFSLFQKPAIQHTNDTSWRYELDKYFNSPRADLSEDIIEWWKRHQSVYPNLASMARDFLAIPAISTSVERECSRATLGTAKLRYRLDNKSIRILMCLNSWIRMDNEYLTVECNY